MARNPWRAVFAFTTIEGLAYVYLGFRTTEAALLYHEGLLAGTRSLCWAAGALGVLAISGVLARRLSGLRLWPSFAIDGAAFLLLSLAIPLRFVSRPSTKSFETSWVPLEWHKLGLNFRLFYEIAPPLTWLVLAVTLGLSLLVARRRPRGVVPAVLVVVILSTSVALLRIGMGDRVIAYLLVFSLPLLVALVASLAHWNRIFCRSAVLGGLATILLAYYMGWVPLGTLPTQRESVFLERLYPPPGEPSAFTLAFFREMLLDREEKALVFAYGPTCGIVRFDLEARTLRMKDFEGLVRYMSLGPGDRIYALDWLNADFLEIDSKTLEVEKTDLFGDRLFTPVLFHQVDGRIVFTSSARPGLVEFDSETLTRTRSFFFEDAGMTRYGSGGWPGDFDPLNGRVYVCLGMTDLREMYSVVEFDVRQFRVSRTVELAKGGASLKFVRERNALLVPSFYTREISVVDLDTYRVTRVLPGPLTCRSLAYDPKRDLVYALGYSSGTLEVVRFGDGQRLMSVAVGNKGLALVFVPEWDQLFIGSTAGILRIDIEKMLASGRARTEG